MVASAAVTDPLPPQAAAAIDMQHLARMTLGEQSLQREVLALFDRQADVLLPRIRCGAPELAASLAHTLKGSAASIGAFKVASAAESVEQIQGRTDRDAAMAVAIERLAAVLDEAKAEIARLIAA
jgi:HPt (histidine-containing phosphotransfer) domain-containing protein